VLGAGLATMALSLTQSLGMFYLLFCFARMVWVGPFDLGLYAALNNWSVARRTLAMSVATLAQMSGLVALPIIAQLTMRDGGWRAGWTAIGATVLIIGFLPVWLFLARRFSVPAAALGAIAFAVSGPVVSTGNFPNMSWSVAAMPWVLWSTDRVIHQPAGTRAAFQRFAEHRLATRLSRRRRDVALTQRQPLAVFEHPQLAPPVAADLAIGADCNAALSRHESRIVEHTVAEIRFSRRAQHCDRPGHGSAR